jgi:translocation and assembly module TamB
MLSGATTPPSAPAAPGFPSRIRMNIHVQTSPAVRFQTSLAEQLSATADLTVLGNLESPGMVGRVNITSGTMVFFGNTYTVNRGSVGFYNASSIQPVLDIDLQTAAQGVTVDLTVSGPIDNMKLSYRSDPPLKFDDIVALLATGRTPPDPTIAVNQPTPPDQSAVQMGESAIVGQAIANPVSDRLQRVFGVSQLKISPQFVAGSSLPQARITLQQQVSSVITFTYAQDLSQANSQLIRVEMQMTPRFSAVATRDENGIFGVDFFYKKQFR